MTRKQTIYEFLRKMKSLHGMDATYTTEEIADAVGATRSNVSSDLNRLFESGQVEKISGWPVRYRASLAVLTPMPETGGDRSLAVDADSVFQNYIGYNGSMSMEIEKAKAAVLYPLNGLPMLIGGKTGVGKTTFAKMMYEYAKKAGRIKPDAKFVSFNCADYAGNPQLIMAQLFGCARGAYTGMEEEKIGIVEQADKGVLFLDEVHRLPDTAQEMLFFLMDFGQYHRLGEASITRNSMPIILMATTEDKGSALLATFLRRIPINVMLPSLDERSLLERLALIKRLFFVEAKKLNLVLKIDQLAVKALLAYNCPGNVGQLENDIKATCAKSYVTCLVEKRDSANVSVLDLPLHVKDGIRNLRNIYSDINLIATSLEIDISDSDRSLQESENHALDIYDVLQQRHKEYSDSVIDRDYIQLAMMIDVETHLNNLVNGQETDLHGDNVLDYITEDVRIISKRSKQLIESKLKKEFSEKYRMVLALHLNKAIARIRAGKDIICPILSSIQNEHPDIFEAAGEIVGIMEEVAGITVPDDETGFIANILECMFSRTDVEALCGIIVICKGVGGAKTMARVANGIVDKECIHWLDVTDMEMPPEKVLEPYRQSLEELKKYKSGVVMLLESEQLEGVADAIKRCMDTPVYEVFSITTSVVIESALLAAEHKATAQQIYFHLKELEQGFKELNEYETIKTLEGAAKKVILTACISGCGAAVRLKKLIESEFEVPANIEIMTIDIASVSALKTRISQIAAVREIICIVGMDVGLEMGFPFISAEEFVIGNGMHRLSCILASHNIVKNVGASGNLHEETSLEDMFFSGKYLGSYLFYLDGEKLAPFLRDCVERLALTRGEMKSGKRIMLFIHICSMVERLIIEKNGTPPKKAAPDLIEAFKPLSAAYNIIIPDEEYDMIEQILELVLNK